MAKLYYYDEDLLQYKSFKPQYDVIIIKYIIFFIISFSLGIGFYNSTHTCSAPINNSTQYIIDSLNNVINKYTYLLHIDSLKKEYKINNNIDKLKHTPLIKPIHPDDFNKDLTLMSGYGKRYHPILGFKRLHTGLDFSAPIGTRVIATADGFIERIISSKTGYGNHIIINHGYNYKTLYGHLSKILIKEGQIIRRGDIIGLVGNSGLSLGSHLHYEVHYNGKKIDPFPYVLDNLTSDDYTKWIYPLD